MTARLLAALLLPLVAARITCGAETVPEPQPSPVDHFIDPDDLFSEAPLPPPLPTDNLVPSASLGVPKVLSGIVDDTPYSWPADSLETPGGLLCYPFSPPLGFAGPSSVLPSEGQTTSDFVPIDDRWRIGFEKWDRYDRGFPVKEDYPFKTGSITDPYNQNVLKGDYPIAGQHTFLRVNLRSRSLFEGRQVPTVAKPASGNPNSPVTMGDPDQYFFTQYFVAGLDLFHGDASFKPHDWRIKLVPVFNLNQFVVDELGIVGPDIEDGTSRFRQDGAINEWFVESKLADLSTDYDFASVRAGSQWFVSDFRGFIFSDVNRGVRLFGTRLANRDQFNLLWFDQTEKDANSWLNTFDDRHQNTWIANYYRQDLIWPGYVGQLSFHFNHDQSSMRRNENGFVVRPTPINDAVPHDIKAYYVGAAGNGHIGRINISNATYFVWGNDTASPLTGQKLDIRALMAAIELSYDIDWLRLRTSYFFASGDSNPHDQRGEGFDAIMDAPVFAGGEFSYWQRQTIRVSGLNLTSRHGFLPSLRTNKLQGQANFVNPGLHLANLGIDADLTQKTRFVSNANALWFDQTEMLESLTDQSTVDSFIGIDLALGMEHRPYLNNHMILVGGISSLLASDGLNDLLVTSANGPTSDTSANGLIAGFIECILEY